MPNKTTNYKLTKPLPEEFYDVNVQNENMDIIDDELKKRISCLATYYPVTSAKNVDELIDPFALIPVSLDINTELFNIVGGTFAYVWTNFYIAATVTNRRMQIAMTYNAMHPKMAFRIYGANGWLKWKGLANDDDATNIPVTSDVPDDADIWIDPNDVSAEEAHVLNMNNPHNVTREQIGAAPAGYGAGGFDIQTFSFSEIDSITENGSYFIDNFYTGVTVNNIHFNYAFLRVSNSGYDKKQELFPIASNQDRIVRAINGDTVTPWESDHPPMELGVEYRTTERHNGKAVYTKFISLGTVVAGDNTIGINIQGITGTCGLELTDEQNCIVTNHMNILSVWSTAIAIVIKAQWEQKLYATIKYVKD